MTNSFQQFCNIDQFFIYINICVGVKRVCKFSIYNRGPECTPFEGGVFPARLSFPTDYPLSPPKMKFTCDLFHPNSKLQQF